MLHEAPSVSRAEPASRTACTNSSTNSGTSLRPLDDLVDDFARKRSARGDLADHLFDVRPFQATQQDFGGRRRARPWRLELVGPEGHEGEQGAAVFVTRSMIWPRSSIVDGSAQCRSSHTTISGSRFASFTSHSTRTLSVCCRLWFGRQVRGRVAIRQRERELTGEEGKHVGHGEPELQELLLQPVQLLHGVCELVEPQPRVPCA